MGDTKIQWANKVWNPVTGCTKISEGCRNCYAERMANRLRGRCGYPEDEPFRVTLHPEKLNEALKWRKPSRVFVDSMGDLFHEDVPFEYIDKIFSTMSLAKKHTFMILTKRPDRMKEYINSDRPNHRRIGYSQFGDLIDWPLSNVWLGVTVENQDQYLRIKYLLNTLAVVRFISVEPTLGAINIQGFLKGACPHGCIKDFACPQHCGHRNKNGIDWVICGGESGPNARPIHPDWVRSLGDQCLTAHVPFFFKQWGEWAYSRQPNGKELLDARKELIVPFRGEVTSGLLKYGDNPVIMARVGKKAAGDLLDGKQYHDFPR